MCPEMIGFPFQGPDLEAISYTPAPRSELGCFLVAAVPHPDSDLGAHDALNAELVKVMNSAI